MDGIGGIPELVSLERPYDWHGLEWPPPHADPDQGWSTGGAHLLLADGSTPYFGTEADAQAIERLRKNSPFVEPGLTAKPNTKWDYSESAWTTERIELTGDIFDGVAATAAIRPDGSVRTVHIHPSGKSSYRVPDLDGIRKTVDRFPNAEILLTDAKLDDATMQVIATLQNLESLIVGTIQLTDQGIKNITRLKSLRRLTGWSDAETAARLKAALPDCELRLTIPKPVERSKESPPDEPADKRD